MVIAASSTRYSPLDGTALGTVSFASPAQAQSIVDASRSAFPAWSATTLEARGKMIRQAASIIEAHTAELADIVRRETGKPLAASVGEVGGAVDMGYLVASHGRHASGHLLPSAIPHRHVRVQRIPLGVALLIVTYNAPLPNYAWKVFPALMAGNTVILKPSPTTAHSANRFAELLWEAGVPPEVLRVIHGEGDIASGLIESGVDLVSFTGSYATGQKVVQKSAVTLAKTIVELGGANPFIVCADADIDKAVETAIDSAYSNAGQRCSSASRILVEESVYDDFRHRFLERTRTLTWGVEPDVDVSTLIDQRSAQAFEGFLSDAEKSGATVHRIGTRVGNPRDDSCLVQPALVEGLGVDSEFAAAEFFGPATRLFSFTDDEAAIRIANASEYGLTAAVWSSDIGRAEMMVSRLEAGVININGPTHGAEINMPFGGVKHSGNGSRDAGIYSIDQYSDVQVVSTFFGV